MELSGNVSAEACLIPFGCTSGGVPFNIAEVAPILSFNKGGEGEILLLGQQPSLFGLPNEANGFPFELDVAGVATVTLYLPQPDASGGLDLTTQTLIAIGQDDAVDFFVDLDNIVATAAGLPGLFASSLDIGTIGSVGFDIIDVQIGPTIDLKQDFELDPTLFVQLLFDQPVLVGGQLLMELISAWDLLPDITFLSDTTTVTPKVFLDALLENSTLLDFDLEFIVDLLQIFYDLGPLGSDSFGIGNVLNESIDLFESPDLYSNLFPLGGFDLQVGGSFVIDFLSGSQPPTEEVTGAPNPLVDNGVPEPGTLLLFFVGLCGFYTVHRLRISPI